jgi:6,7-dimethyl-8-ribityllumazine synthase
MTSRDIDSTSENVLHDWANAEEGSQDESAGQDELAADSSEDASPAWGSAATSAEPAEAAAVEADEEAGESDDVEPELPEPEPGDAEPAADATGIEIDETPMQVELSHEHAAGDLHIPDGYAVLEGVAEGGRRAVGVVVSRFNGSITTQLLDGALAELSAAGVRQDAITIMVVPGAFELPLAATALAKTRRFACIVALGCVIRGDTPHFDYVSSEAASGLQLAALETGVPVAFGVLTLDRLDQAEARVGKGAEAVRSALEMADLFAHLRAAAAR